MKKIFIAVCLCFCGLAVSAQTSSGTDKEYEAELSRYFKVSGSDASFKVAMDQVLQMVGSSYFGHISGMGKTYLIKR